MTIELLGTNWIAWLGMLFLFSFSSMIYAIWFLFFTGRSSGILYAAVAAQVAYVGQVLAVLLVLGWLGVLRPLPVVIVSALITATVYGVLVRSRMPQALDRIRLFAGLIRKIRIPPWAGILFLLAAVVLLRNLFWGWFLPPYMRDDIAYHLTIMGNMIQSGAIRYFPSPSEWIRDYPVNSELFQAWNFLFVGVDKLVDLAFLPTVIVGGMALYGICRRFGFSRRASVAGWAVYAFTPLVILQQTGSYNDAWKAALFVCGIYLVLARGVSSGETGARGTAVLAGICSGVILGTKFSGILDGLAVGALLVLAVWRGAPDGAPGIKTGVKSALRGLSVPLVAFFLSTMFYGAYPLIRNAVIEGNPIAPVEVKIGTWTMWPGKSASDFPSIGSEEVLEKAGNGGELFYLIWFEKFQLFFDPNNSGSGPIWLFLGIPGAVLWIGQSFRKRNGPAIAISVLSVMILLLTPAQWRPRYVLSLLLICGLGAALLVESLRAGPKRAVLSLLALSAAYVTVITLRPSPVEPEKAMAYVFRSDDLQRNAGSAQPDNEFFQWVEERTRSSPAVIVYGRWVDSYPLFGADLRNTVISLAANSAETWDRQLAERAVELVVTAAGSPEEAWTRDSGDYTEVFRYDSWAVWERN